MTSVLDTLGASLAIEQASYGRSAEDDALDTIEPPDFVVGMIGSAFVIQFPDGHWITDPDQVRAFALVNLTQPKETPAMYDSFSPYEIQSADEASALLERHNPEASGVVQMIGAKATSIVLARKAGQTWAALARANRVATVTLDTDPEVPGRPQSLRPGTPQLQLIALPEWHHLNGDGSRDLFGVVYYLPVTTWTTRAEVQINPNTGAPEVIQPNVLAAQNDPAGFIAVTQVLHMTSTQVDEWQADLRNAVRAMSAPDFLAEYDEEADDLSRADRLAQQMRELSAL